MSRILTYCAGVVTGVLAGVLGYGILIAYTEVESPGYCAKYSEYVDKVIH